MITEFSKTLELNPLDVLGKSRVHPLPLARQMYWKCLREKTAYTFQTIGRLNERSHATILNGIKKVNDLLSINDKLAVGMWEKVKGINN